MVSIGNTSAGVGGVATTFADEPLRWVATLVRGRFYSLRTKVFRRGVPVPVTDWEKRHLEAHAVERLLHEDFDPEGDELMEDAIEAVCALTFVPLECAADDPIPHHIPETPPGTSAA